MSILKLVWKQILFFNICLCCLCQTVNAAEHASVLLVNANGYTFDENRTLKTFNRLLIVNGKVAALDNNIEKIKGLNPVRIDLQGKTLLPGLIDAHGHILGLGFSLNSVDLRKSASAADAVKQVYAFSEKHTSQQWIRGRGWNQELWPDKQFPTADLLDKLIPDRPVWLRRIDGHAGWANSAALRLAGIDKHTPSPPGGEILKDKSGQPTGVFIDNAMSLITTRLPEYNQQESIAALETAQQHLLSLGLTSVHDAGIDFSTYQLYQQQAKQKHLKMRIYAMLAGDSPQLNTMLDRGPVKDSENFLSIRSIKLYTDGALGSRGAALLEPYHDRPDTKGLLVTQPADLRRLYRSAAQHDFQINVHSIGDRGVKLALDEFEHMFSSFPRHTELRNRIEHAQVARLEDIPRFKSLNIIPSMQPTHATSDKNMAHDRLGSKRLQGAYAWRKFLQQGSKIAAGSDFPIELANPFHGLHAAVTRQDHDNNPPGGWIPSESMTREEALRAFTVDAAFAAHQENILGNLMPGKWADFIVIDRNIFTVQAQDIWKTRVLETWVAGKRVFKSP